MKEQENQWRNQKNSPEFRMLYDRDSKLKRKINKDRRNKKDDDDRNTVDNAESPKGGYINPVIDPAGNPNHSGFDMVSSRKRRKKFKRSKMTNRPKDHNNDLGAKRRFLMPYCADTALAADSLNQGTSGTQSDNENYSGFDITSSKKINASVVDIDRAHLDLKLFEQINDDEGEYALKPDVK